MRLIYILLMSFHGLGLVGEPLYIDVDPTYEATQMYPRRIPVTKKKEK